MEKEENIWRRVTFVREKYSEKEKEKYIQRRAIFGQQRKEKRGEGKGGNILRSKILQGDQYSDCGVKEEERTKRRKIFRKGKLVKVFEKQVKNYERNQLIADC